MTLAGILLGNLEAPEDQPTLWRRPPLSDKSFWTRLVRYGVFWQAYLFSDPFIQEDESDEYWIPRRALGSGAWGKVGLWELKRSEDGQIVDRVAMKQRDLDQDPDVYMGAWTRHLATEAMIQSQLCSMPNSENIIRLRKYKWLGPADAPSGTIRLYMEYAKHGTLEQLLNRYRAWDMHFNELFLWHIFLGLARAIDLMRRCPAHWQPTLIETPEGDYEDVPNDDRFILHLDLKTANVALGKRKRFEFGIGQDADDQSDDADSIVTWPEDEDEEEEDELGMNGGDALGPQNSGFDWEEEEEAEEEGEELGSEDTDTDEAEYHQNETLEPVDQAAGNGHKIAPLNDRPAANAPQMQQGLAPQEGSNDNSDIEFSSMDEDIIRNVGIDNTTISTPAKGGILGDNPADYETDNDEEEHPDRLPKYPTVKIIDFGCARCTGPDDDPTNPHELAEVGTEYWQAPEARWYADTETLPPHNYGGGKWMLDEKVNVYDVGKIMYDMITLSRYADVDKSLDAMVPPDGVWQQTYRRPFGPTQQPLRHWTEDVKTTKRDEYSVSLRNLTRRCIRPCRSYRPSSARLLELVEAGLKKHLQRLSTEQRLRRGLSAHNRNRVNLRVAEFNKIKRRGEANRQVQFGDTDDEEEWGNLMDTTCADLDDPIPSPPRDKWATFYRELPPRKSWPDVLAENWDQVGRNVVFDKGRRKKRVVSWEASMQPNAAFRGKLRTIKTALGSLVAEKPIRLLEYVLNQEKGDQDTAIEVLKWMYGRGRNVGRWSWCRDESVIATAQVVKKSCPRRMRRECLYFVACVGVVPERADGAVRDLVGVFG